MPSLVLCVALGLSTGCSSNDKPSAAGTAPTSAPTSQPGAAVDDNGLGPGLLQPADIGAPWRAAPLVTAGEVAPTDLSALCGRSVPPPPQAGLAGGFVRDETGDAVTHTVRRYEPGQAVPAVGSIAAAGVACKEWPVGARKTKVAIQPLATPDLGERWVGFRIRTVDSEHPFAADVIAWQRGDYVSILTTVGVKLLDADLTKRLLPIADDRLKRLAGG